MTLKNRTGCMIIALMLCGAAPALAQTAPPGGFGGFHAAGFRGGYARVGGVGRVGAVGVGYHPYVARGAWYRGAPYAAAAVGGAALGAAAVGAAAANAYPYCGYYPYPPCY